MRTLVLSIVLAPLAATSLLAAEPAPGSFLGKYPEAVAQALASQGYRVREIERDEGYMAVEAYKEGREVEIYVDPQNGEVVRVKQDDGK